MSNIVTELSKKKKEDGEKTMQDHAVQQIKLLEQGNAIDDLRIANALGGNHAIARAQTELGKAITLEKLEGQYDGDVYTTSQIKDLARKYNMRFLKSKFYCGNLDLAIFNKLRHFSEHSEPKVSIDNGNLAHHFFILAPEKCFHLEEEVIDRDPALFYKIDEGHYRLIHQWGTDFNILNRIAGWNWESRDTKFLTHFLIKGIVGLMVLFTGMSFLPLASTGKSATLITFMVITGVWALISPFVVAYSDWHVDGQFHGFKWRNSKELVEKKNEENVDNN